MLVTFDRIDPHADVSTFRILERESCFYDT